MNTYNKLGVSDYNMDGGENKEIKYFYYEYIKEDKNKIEKIINNNGKISKKITYNKKKILK